MPAAGSGGVCVCVCVNLSLYISANVLSSKPVELCHTVSQMKTI